MTSSWIFLILTLLCGAAAHFVASARVPSHDCGGFWARVLDGLSIWIGLPLLVVSSVHSMDFARRWLPSNPDYWLAIVGAAWLVVMAAALVKGNPDEGRWIAGTLEFRPHRFWLALFALPFLPALFFTAAPWVEDVYAAHWAITAVFLVTLAGLALSAAPVNAWSGGDEKRQAAVSIALSDWPEEMRSRGVGLRDLAAWEPAPTPEPASGMAAEWQRRLTAAGSHYVSGPLCRGVSRVMGWSPHQEERVAIVLGPDDCGQEEVVALAATELSRRHGEATLVITSSPCPALAGRLRGWLDRLGGENPARLLDLCSDSASTQAGDLLLADAETLSDSILDHLRDELHDYGGDGRGFGRIGLVVWWNAHEFSGVLAAHVWAVSRRLERLLKSRRGLAVGALVFARRPREREGPMLAFLEHLLPYSWKKENEFQIGSDFLRRTHLYQLEDNSPTAAAKAAEASLLTDWPTLVPEGIPLPATLPHPPAESGAAAGARVLDLRAAEMLSLREIVCQGGRSTEGEIEHHVALPANENPYIDFLLSRLSRQQEETGASVNLVGAEGHPDVVRRHLLLALREVPDTLTGLRSTFRWEETMLRNTLHRLSAETRLSRVPVRFLDSNGRLQRDSLYANQNPGQDSVRSFRTIGRSAPVELRDPNVKDRLLMQVDPERLPIDAYPLKTFTSGGRNYRVQRWQSASPTRIACQPVEPEIRTWRFATSRISSIKRGGESLTFRGMERYTAQVQYSEDVTGLLERDASGRFNSLGIEAVRTSFETEALMLEFTGVFAPLELVSAAAALRHVLPVHVALEEEALDVVPFTRQSRQGLALVDLYPGGVGVVGAIHKTVWLIPMLFDQVAEWLLQNQDSGSVQKLSQSPLVRTMNLDRLDLKGALRVFTAAAMHAK